MSVKQDVKPADAVLLRSVAQHFYEDDYENGPSELVLRLRALANVLASSTSEDLRNLRIAADLIDSDRPQYAVRLEDFARKFAALFPPDA